jgi:protein TonB
MPSNAASDGRTLEPDAALPQARTDASRVSEIVPAAPDGLAPAKDRLTTMLFLAGLFHAIVIIGVSFDMPNPFRAHPVPTIEVLLLGGDPASDVKNDDARYLADRAQDGGGTTEERVRPASPQSSMIPAEIEGAPDGTGVERRDPTPATARTEVLTSRSVDPALAVKSGTDSAAEAEETPMALSATNPARVATNTSDDRLALRGDESRELVVAADTRESTIAPYLDAWKRKTEQVGTLNYPRAARRQEGASNPVLEVTIRADGSLADVRIVRSSGHREIDQAALQILRLAAPFDPFPTRLRKQYETLRFAYEWQFLGDRGAALQVRPGSG